MVFTWLLVISGLVVIPVVFTTQQGHVEADCQGTAQNVLASRYCGIGRAEPGGILFGPY